MRIVLRVALTAVAALLSLEGHAETYVGLSRTTPGEAYADFATARNVVNYNNPLALKLYGGMQLTERYAIEAGYGAFGTWKIADPASSNEVHIASRLVYAAGKASLNLNDSVALFGKAGLAANRITTDGTGSASVSTSFVRPMAGAGISYQLTPRIGAVLEFNYYGAHKGFKQQKLELGVKASF